MTSQAEPVENVETTDDDLDAFFADLDALMTPTQRAEFAAWEAAFDRAVDVPCAWGWCSHLVDPETGKIVGGAGPVLCPCDHLPGWRANRLDSQAKPAVPVKARGRHGSRVQRSRTRHTLPVYDSLGAWLPAHTRPHRDLSED